MTMDCSLESLCSRMRIQQSSSNGAPSKEQGFDLDTLMKTVDDTYRHWKTSSNSSKLTQSTTTSAPKSSQNSIEFRILGNKEYEKIMRDYEALYLYTKSVAFALEGSEESALAYSNRSAVLFRLCRYIPCLLDINRALECDYPQRLKKKLINRKKDCLVQISKSNGTKINFDATDPLDTMLVDSHDDTDEWRSMGKFGNLLLPNCSPKIKLRCDDQWGRFIEATEDIDPGEILSSQRFFLASLQPETQHTHCSYCLVRCYALIPCLTCSNMMYCSKKCREQADQTYHRIECKLSANGRNKLIFASTRALLVGTEQGAKLKNLMEEFTLEDVFEEKYDPTNKPFIVDYLSLLRLHSTSKLPPVAFIWIAVEIIVELRYKGFFKNSSTDPADMEQDHLSEEELFAAMLWLNQVLSFNMYCFSVYEIKDRFDGNQSLLETTIGSGINVLHSLINHSCDPNVWFLTRNREHVIFAARPIRKGEQIFTSYCDTFFCNPIENRATELLEKYRFICTCQACVDGWPLTAELRASKTVFLCSKGNVMDYMKRQLQPFIQRKGVLKLSNRRILQMACRHSKWLHENVKKPSIVFTEFADFLLSFMTLSYNKSSQEFMSKYRKSQQIETNFLRIMECFQNS